MMVMMLLIGMDTHRVLRDDGDPASQFAQTKLRDVHLGIIVVVIIMMIIMLIMIRTSQAFLNKHNDYS